MKTFVIRRRAIAATAAELDGALNRLRAFEEGPHSIKARWIRSYALRESDGRFGLTCVFQAETAAALRQHAERVALPGRGDRAGRGYGARTSRCPDDGLRDPAPQLLEDRGRSREERSHLAARVGDEEMANQVSWIRTYAVQESSGALGTVCIYQGVDPQALSEHAARVGMPADEITQVIGRIVYREDPLEAPAVQRCCQNQACTRKQPAVRRD